MWTFSVGTTVNLVGFGVGGGGGTFFNVGHNSSEGWLSGWSFSITGTAGGGGGAGLGAGLSASVSLTNADCVDQLLGIFLEAGKGLGRTGIAYFQSPDGEIIGTNVAIAIRSKGAVGASVGASNTVALIQWVQGKAITIGTASKGAIMP